MTARRRASRGQPPWQRVRGSSWGRGDEVGLGWERRLRFPLDFRTDLLVYKHRIAAPKSRDRHVIKAVEATRPFSVLPEFPTAEPMVHCHYNFTIKPGGSPGGSCGGMFPDKTMPCGLRAAKGSGRYILRIMSVDLLVYTRRCRPQSFITIFRLR